MLHSHSEQVYVIAFQSPICKSHSIGGRGQNASRRKLAESSVIDVGIYNAPSPLDYTGIMAPSVTATGYMVNGRGCVSLKSAKIRSDE